MVKEALSRIIHPIRRHGRRLLWVSRKAQPNSGDPKLSATNNSLKLPKRFSFQNSARTLLIAIAGAILLSTCSTPTTHEPKEPVRTSVSSTGEPEGAVNLSGQILEKKIVVRGKDPDQWHYFDFKVSEAGSAMLILLNGARIGSSPQERVQDVQITLNDKVVMTPKKFKKIDVLEVPVGLQGGANRLGVQLPRAGLGKRLAVLIDAPALAPQPELIIYGPVTVPPAIPPSQTAVPVTFRAFVATPTPPQVLFLHEVNEEGELINPPVAELRDNGKDGDTRPGDLTYAGTLNIRSPEEKGQPVEGEKYYRLRADYFGETILSAIYTFHVTTFPIGIRPSESKLVKIPKSKFRIFSNEVAMGIRPGVPVDRARIEEIASAAEGTVVGFWPPLRLYQVKIPGKGTAGVRKAIAAISTFSEVAYAVPNHETIPLQSTFPDVPPQDLGFPPNCASDPCQWYMEKIDALKAWGLARGGSPNKKVAVIEARGGVDFEHPDLQMQGSQMSFCYINSLGDRVCKSPSLSDRHRHATQVAGLIAARADNAGGIGTEPGIAGVAYASDMLAYFAVGTTQQSAAIDKAVSVSDGARIINLSLGNSQGPDLQTAINTAINNSINTNGALVVAAAGNPLKNGTCPTTGATTNIWPAKYNEDDITFPNLPGGFLAVAATDNLDALAEWDVVGSDGITRSFCTNRTSWIDLYAPGTNIYSTTFDPNNLYEVAEGGTSFAAALTSGAAAVLWNLNPGWSPQRVHDRLINTAEQLPTTRLCKNGTCGRLDLFAAVKNGVLKFDGVDDFVKIPSISNLDLQQGLTLEAWVRIDNADFFHRPLISNGVGFGSYTLGILGDDTLAVPGTLAYVHRVATGNFSCCAPARITFGTWTHVAATYTGGTGGGTATVYINGQMVTDAFSPQPPVPYNDPLFLGRAVFQSIDDQFHRGYLDEVRLWEGVRSESKIKENYRQEIVNPTTASGLIGYWKFEGNGQTVLDSSINGHHGFLGRNETDTDGDPTREIIAFQR